MKYLNKNQKGFSSVEVLIIAVVISLLGLVGWNVYQRTAKSSSNTDTSATSAPNALLYASFDGLAMKVNSFDLVSGQKKQVLEQKVSEPDTRNRPFSVLDAKVSTDKQLVAYRFGTKGKVKIIKSDGEAVGEVLRSETTSFDWLQNERQLLLEVSNYVDCPSCGMSLNGPASDWYIYDVDNGKETKLDIGDNSFNVLEGQSEDTLYFAATSPYGGISPQLYAYDIGSHTVSEINLPGDEGIQIGFVSTSPGGKHTIVSILPAGYGAEYSCTIYEINGKKLGAKLVDDANYQCENAFWSNDNEFYFDKSTGPSGKITTSDNSPSGYYVLLSVYKFDFSNKQQEKVLISGGNEVYRLMGSLADGSFIVSNEANKRNPQYKLEIRNADGSFKNTIEHNQKEMLIIGSVR